MGDLGINLTFGIYLQVNELGKPRSISNPSSKSIFFDKNAIAYSIHIQTEYRL
jgi:hypothetical protein